jgi:hypothetical protein
MIGLLPFPPAAANFPFPFDGALLSGETSGFSACRDGFFLVWRERGVMVSSREPVWVGACIGSAEGLAELSRHWRSLLD